MREIFQMHLATMGLAVSMKGLIFRGACLITPLEWRFTDLLVQGGQIAALGPMGSSGIADCEVVDASGTYLSPGLFDLQVNGGPGCDLWSDLNLADFAGFSSHLLRAGVTAFLPTLITDDLGQMVKHRDFIRENIMVPRAGQVFCPGIHFEGPFLSPKRPGVHPVEQVRIPDLEQLAAIVDSSLKLITIAPETDPTGACLSWLLNQGLKVSLGHSNATFEEACLAFERGTRLVTHLFNAMPPLHHREPGAVGAALLDKRVSCCVIADGKHLSPAILDLIYRLKGKDKLILVSDSAQIGTSEGGLVGSSIVLSQAVKNLVEWSICSFAEAICMATYNPASAIGLETQIGSLCVGARADLVLWDRTTLGIMAVYSGGKRI